MLDNSSYALLYIKWLKMKITYRLIHMNINTKFNSRNSIAPTRSQLKLIYWALMFGRLLQVGLLYTVFQPTEKMTEDELVIYLVILIASFEGMISSIVYNKIQNPDFIRSKFFLFFYENLRKNPTIQSTPDKDSKQNIVGIVISQLSIICWALSFSVGVLGMLIPFLGGNNTEGVALIVASLLIGIFQRPK